jgi:hypothetical protein
LSRALIDEKLVGAEPVTLCYFFFKDNEEQNSAATALCALFHQFLCVHSDLLQRYVAPAYTKCGDALKNDFEELWRTFILAATDPSAKDVVCILDALDECKVADRNKLISHLEDFYRRSDNTSQRGSKLKFLVTSRPYGEIELKFSPLIRSVPNIRLAGEDESEKISNEIGFVIQAKVKEIAETCKLTDLLRSSLHKRLCEVPNRTYLWLHLTLEEVSSKIRKGKTKKNMLAIINTLSSTIEEAYQEILEKCEDKEEASRILQIIVAAQRPLTVDELDVALELEPDSTAYEDLNCQYETRKESIRENCGLFVSIVDSRIYLIHQTAREFLIRNNNVSSGVQGWKHSIDLQEAQQALSEKCITYLLLREFQQHPASPKANTLSVAGKRSAGRPHARRHAFLDYSANYWISHVREAGINNTSWIGRTARLCDIGDASSCAWFSIYSKSDYRLYSYRRVHQTALYWAVVLGLIYETGFLLNISSDSDGQESSFRSVILEAARNEGYGKELMTLLLDRRGADVSITEEVVNAAAWRNGNSKEMMTLLLDRRGADVLITEKVVASIVRRFDKDVVALLLDRRGADVSITEEVVDAAAANYGNSKEVMTLLLDRRRADVPITEKVVASIVRRFDKDVVALLLDRRVANVSITEEVVDAAAANYGNGKEVMTLLLDRRGADVPITEKVVKAAVANYGNGKEVMTLLLDRRGADVPITEKVVASIVRRFDKDVVALLLDRRGADAPITEKVVAAIVRRFNKDIVALLLNRRGADVSITEEVVDAAAAN